MLDAKTQQFIQQHQHADVHHLLLKQHQFKAIDLPFAVQQILGKRKAKIKLPTWYQNGAIIYPPTLSMQQCSSESTAAYKATLLQGNTLVDMTGGFGVDTTHFATRFKTIHFFEQQVDLCQIAQHNFKIFGLHHIQCYPQNSIDFIQALPQKISAIYLDPARRNAQKHKVITLTNSTPNILAIKSLLLKKADVVLLKASPMLDITLAIEQLEQVDTVHVVAVNHDCKEVLFELKKQPQRPIQLHCVHFLKNQPTQSISTAWGDAHSTDYALPQSYIYEPNKTILKAGIVNKIGNLFRLAKLHPNTHLYTSNVFIRNFPGRIFQLEMLLKPQKKAIQKTLPNRQANLTIRNYPATVAQLRKKLGLKEGGKVYLFGTTLLDNRKVLLMCLPIGN